MVRFGNPYLGMFTFHFTILTVRLISWVGKVGKSFYINLTAILTNPLRNPTKYVWYKMVMV